MRRAKATIARLDPRRRATCAAHVLSQVERPWAATMDDFSLEEAIDRLCQGVVVTVTDATDRGFDACLAQPFGVFDRQILAGSVAVVNEPLALGRSAFMDRLF